MLILAVCSWTKVIGPGKSKLQQASSNGNNKLKKKVVHVTLELSGFGGYENLNL
jgi:hypothetical protein